MALTLLHIKLEKKIPKKDRREKKSVYYIKILMLCGHYLKLHTIKWAAYASFNLFVLFFLFLLLGSGTARKFVNVKKQYFIT